MTIEEIKLDKVDDEWDFDKACQLAEILEDFILGDANDYTLALACLMVSATYIDRAGMRIGIAASILHGFVRNVHEYEQKRKCNSDQH